MIKLGVKYIENDVIATYANEFLQKHHRNKSIPIPIPIEEIIDLNFNVNIIPLPGVQDLCDVEGFISPDFSSIYVDEYVYKNRPYRFRFTLAHEIGHMIIHKEKLNQIKIDPIDAVSSWAKIVCEIDGGDHSKLEYQGYTFGGLVLVPPNDLLEQFHVNLPKVEPLIEEAKKVGASRRNYLKYAIDHMASVLSPIFDVSTDVLIRRIAFDNIDQLFP